MNLSFKEISQPLLFLLLSEKRSWYLELSTTLLKLIQVEKQNSGPREDKLEAISSSFYREDIADDLVR